MLKFNFISRIKFNYIIFKSEKHFKFYNKYLFIILISLFLVKIYLNKRSNKDLID